VCPSSLVAVPQTHLGRPHVVVTGAAPPPVANASRGRRSTPPPRRWPCSLVAPPHELRPLALAVNLEAEGDESGGNTKREERGRTRHRGGARSLVENCVAALARSSDMLLSPAFSFLCGMPSLSYMESCRETKVIHCGCPKLPMSLATAVEHTGREGNFGVQSRGLCLV
jgi:hypothetical protein